MDILSNAEFDRILRYALLGAQRTDWDRIMDTDAAVLPEPIFSPRYLRRRARMLKEPFRNIDGIEFYRIGDDIFSGDVMAWPQSNMMPLMALCLLPDGHMWKIVHLERPIMPNTFQMLTGCGMWNSIIASAALL